MATPDLMKVIMDAIRYQLGEVNTAIPAVINKYDPTKQEAEVIPLIKRKYKDGTAVNRAPITGVPVVFPAAGGGIITFPVKKGDTVLLIFSQRSIDRWVRGNGSQIDPSDNRKHDISDAIAIPGLFSFSSALQSDPDNVIIKFSGASIALTPAGAIEILAPGGVTITGDLTVSGNIVATEVTASGKALSTHTHPIVSGSSAPGPTGPPT